MTKQHIVAKFHQYKQLIPLLLLTAYCVDAIWGYLTESSILSLKHYSAIALIIINFLVYFYKIHYYKYTLTTTIVLGLFSLVIFPAATNILWFAIGSLKIKFQKSALLAALLTYILNFNRINNAISNSLISKSSPEAKQRPRKEIAEEEIQKFKKLYSNYSTDNLAKIITERKHVPAAIQAAKQLLDEKQ